MQMKLFGGAKRNSIKCVAALEKKKKSVTIYIRKSPLGSQCLAHFHSYFLCDEATSFSALLLPIFDGVLVFAAQQSLVFHIGRMTHSS